MSKLKLGDICSIKKGRKVEQTEQNNNSIRYIQIEDLRSDGHIKYCEKKENYVIANSSDIIIAWDGANAGTIGFGLNGAIGSTLAILKLNRDDLDTRFIGLLLRGKFTYLRNNCTGATIPHISRKSLEEIRIPLLPLEIQKQIAKNLDTASELLAMRKQQLAELDNLIKSVFYDMFGDLSLNPLGWKVKKFTDVAYIDTNMTVDFENFADYPHIGIDSIEKNTGEILSYKLVKESNLISGKYLFSDNHIIYSKIRPNLNKVALPSFSGLCSADAYPIMVKDNIANKYYLAYVMRSDFFLSYILDFSGRTNIPKVNKKQIETFKLPLPPLSLQNQFATIVTKIEEQKSLVHKAIDETQLLFDSLMSQYFDQ